MRTIVYIAHPDVTKSSSHQFLLSSGQANSEVVYVDLNQDYQANNRRFDSQAERERLMKFDRIIFQFQLYWYQAPAIMKIWLDAILDTEDYHATFQQSLHGKQLGLVVLAGVKAEHYQAGGREGRTLSELLSPYELLARHFGMHYLMPFTVHQFHYMDEPQKFSLMMRYACFLETGEASSFRSLQYYILNKLENLSDDELELSTTDQLLMDMFINELQDQADDLDELTDINEAW
ncbi:hypothetical protein GIY11_09100 [Aerococcaceae bacterium DSM 109653]|uniref:Flavodoxin-like fold domain-containing protein n=1 Tax=Fundicoccus ignavus TaxID=2664442 RepID=A0A844BVK0_9LACT|nr:NAD(P)H-dependent oxidoreductase [Fundicoccus ignavus]MRI82162.1 hypothetical protein [Fundicoccus ignavus]